MLLLATNMQRQALDVHNNTFEPVEVTCFKTHTQGSSLHRLSIRPARNEFFIFQNLPYYYEVIYERANSE